ncbi:MAG: sterol desaturase family protein [bacterium]
MTDTANAADALADRAERRARIAAANIPRRYSGALHVGYFNALALAVIGAALAGLDRPTAFEIALAPLFLVFANAFEWWIHRGPMHHPWPHLRELYDRHTLSHHAYFTDRDMEIASARELKMVLFPPFALPFFIALTSPLPLAAGILISANAARIFFASAITYYLIYEWLHLIHHLPRSSWIGRRRWISALRAHHTRHHDPRRMTLGNFNVSFPLWDRVRGTLLSDALEAAGAPGPNASAAA